MGLPTANLEQVEQLTPAEGVYAGQARLHKQCYMAAISVGTAVTFDHGERLVEAILLDFNEDIYEKQMQLEFHLHLRQQLRFSSVDELAQQIRADCEKVRELCEKGEIKIPPTEPNE
jgi:riboflavin kinase/FMN adenylyltransferase